MQNHEVSRFPSDEKIDQQEYAVVFYVRNWVAVSLLPIYTQYHEYC